MMDPRRPDKQQKYKPPASTSNAAPGEDLTPDYMNILDSRRKCLTPPNKCGDRFKVVKIESTKPFKRGRWECMDFLDQSYERMVNYNSVIFKASETNLSQNCVSDENKDFNGNAQGSMLQIFQQQNNTMAQEENKINDAVEDISIPFETYVANKNGNYVLLPGMVSTSLIGIKYPFELNFLPINMDGEKNLMSNILINTPKKNASNCSISSEAISNNSNNIDNLAADLKTKVSCHIFDNRQMNHEPKMSTGNIHYIQQNAEIQSAQEVRIKNNQEQINHEVFNNYNSNNIEVPVNTNVMQNINQNPNNCDVNVYPNNNIQEKSTVPHKEIIDNQNYKPTIINHNNIQPPVPNAVVYQQPIYTKEIQQEQYQNINSNNCNNVPEKVCNVANIPPQNFNQEMHKNITCQPVNNVNECNNPQIITKLTNQSICQTTPNNLTVRTQTYDVKPEGNNQNTNVYKNNNVYPQQVNYPNMNNHSSKSPEYDMNYKNTQTINEKVQYNCQNPNLQKYTEVPSFDSNTQTVLPPNQGMVQNSMNYFQYFQETRPLQKNVTNVMPKIEYDNPNTNRKTNFVANEQYQMNKNDVNYQKTVNVKEEFSNVNSCSRPTSAKFTQETEQKSRESPSKYASSSTQFSFIPDVLIPDNISQTSMHYANNLNSNSSNIGLNQNYVDNNTLFVDQTQFFMPCPFGQSGFNHVIQNPIYVPVFSNTIQMPVCLNNQNSNPGLCEQVLSETALNRRPIGYQKVWVPHNGNSNMPKRPNQYSSQVPSSSLPNRPQTDGVNFEPGSYAENSPRSEAYPNTIDVKIEALMDLVKKHLKFTIMEDVHSLKQRILNLKERVAQLEYENELLRSHNEENKKFTEKL